MIAAVLVFRISADTRTIRLESVQRLRILELKKQALARY